MEFRARTDCHHSAIIHDLQTIAMLSKYCLTFFLILAAPLLPHADPLIVGYLPHYKIDTVSEEQLSALTDLVLFGPSLKADGSLDLEVLSVSVLEKLKRRKENGYFNMHLTVGGWGKSNGFATASMTKQSRNNLIEKLLNVCVVNHFDGIDYDWEHPKGKEELLQYTLLIEETSAAFKNRGMIVSVAQASWQNLGKRLYAVVDRIHLMSYDHAFPQATLEKSTEDAKRLIEWGCPARKILLGIPFYGRDRNREAISYAELTKTGTPKPNEDQIRGYAFNNKLTVAAKLNLVDHLKLGGLMIWEVGQDTVDPKASLLKFIKQRTKQTGK
ncbi:glycoside hydrolase family 18 protein [Verrucomicrobia bacterium]|nr:glycoside hydrolase family 18 protein [Verrucomicrobiota bacterium]